ncbi:MAG: lysylphosphatidylglycerol synthase domain-containing protein [Bradyrhizobium sp.]
MSILLLVGVIAVVGLNTNLSGLVGDARKIPLVILALVLLSLFGNALGASLRFRVVAMQIGHRVTFRHAIAAVCAGSLVGTLFFQIAGQLIGRSFVMARTAVPVASVVVITAYERFVAAVVSALLALAGAYFVFGNVYLDQNAGGGALIKIMLGLLAATGTGALLGYGRLAARSVAPWLTKNFATGFLQLVVLTAIVQFPMMLAYVLVAHSLSPLTPIPGLVATSAIVMFAASVPISVAGWGIREMSAVVALGAIGVAPQDALLAAILVGTGSMLTLVTLAGFSLPGFIRRPAETSNRMVGKRIDFERALVWVVPLAVATLVFFQIYVPIGSGTLLNVNLADPLAILGGVLFVLMALRERKLPQWRYRYMNSALAAASLLLTISLFIGAARFGWTHWAEVNRYLGWYILLAYAGSGALITRDFGREALRILLLTFAGAGVAIAAIEIVLLALHNLGLQSSLPLVASQLEAFSLNHNFFAFQLLMVLAAVFAAVRGPTLRISLSAVVLTALYFSDSRSGWITAAVVLAASVYIRASAVREIGGAVLCALGIGSLIVAAPLLTDHILSSRIPGLASHVVSSGMPSAVVAVSDTTMRMESILGGLHLFLQHPILGAGLGAFRNKLIIFPDQEPLLIHSTPVWLLAELGIIGLLTFSIPAVYALVVELRRRCADTAGQLIVLCLTAFGVMSLPADMLYQRTFWLLLGAALILKPNLEQGNANDAVPHRGFQP